MRGGAAHVLGGIAVAGLGAPLVALAMAGVFGRYAADDYCTAGQVQVAGFLDAQSRLYLGWSGRFATTFMVTLIELIGARAVAYLPMLALIAWVAAATFAARAIARALGLRLPAGWAAVLALLVALATLQMTADLPQILYWQTGMLTYLWPLVLATAFVGWVAHVAGCHARPVRWPVALGVSFTLAFVAGGSSETFAAAQVTGLALALGISSATRGSTHFRGLPLLQAMLLFGLVGALLALAIVAVAPGNNVRQETAVQTPLSMALPQALEFTQGWLRLTFARPHAVVLLLLVGIPAAMGAATGGSQRTASDAGRTRVAGYGVSTRLLWLASGGAATGLVIFACMLPAFYALGSNPPGRAQVIPQYVLVCGLAALGWALGRAMGSRIGPILREPAASWAAAAGLVVLLGLGPLPVISDIVEQIAPARAYAAAWDQLDTEVRTERARGVLDVTVRPLPSTGLIQNLDFIGPHREDWLNACVARYYDLNTIASTLT